MRLEIIKTYKIYIGGAFPRTESGRYYTPLNKQGEKIAHVCLCSSKDVKNAVVAARKAFGSWSERSAFNRSQILYRIAEMLEGRKSQFIEELQLQGSTEEDAKIEVEQSIDRIVYYAGWCDKINQVAGSVNPVSSSHFNFSVLQPMGVVGIIADQTTSLIGLVSQMLPVIASGNTVVVLASENKPLSAVTFAEVIHSSDVPGGVINILTGNPNELAPILAAHMDVNALQVGTDELTIKNQLFQASSANLKRVVEHIANWSEESNQGLYYITDFMELKTTWHPIENIGGSTSVY
ncbi:MAG TPA: aldehyde dehydrogenase family protein [Taishania sp.]|nr:aldehyde dehydrogenase family protein [Taishania sp.]